MWINHSTKQYTQPFYERGSGRTCSLLLQIHCASLPVRGLRPVTGLRRALFFLMSVLQVMIASHIAAASASIPAATRRSSAEPLS